MSEDLDAVLREMWPGLHPGERRYSAAWLDDRRLQAVPDKEQNVDLVENSTDTRRGGAVEKKVPLSDALATFAETVGDAGHINADVHGLPIQFFGRDDVENVDVLVSQGRVLITGNLVVGGHKFVCFSKGFPMGAE